MGDHQIIFVFPHQRVEINLSPTGVFPKPIECGSIYMFKEYESIHRRNGFLQYPSRVISSLLSLPRELVV